MCTALRVGVIGVTDWGWDGDGNVRYRRNSSVWCGVMLCDAAREEEDEDELGGNYMEEEGEEEGYSMERVLSDSIETASSLS